MIIIQFISEWVKNIILLVLISTFLTMFLPEGSMKKYLKVIMGFFILSVFISPLATFLDQDINNMFDIVPENTIKQSWREIESQGRAVQKVNDDIIENRSIESLTNRISEIINITHPDWQKEIKVNINENNYSINNINIKLINDNREEIEIEPIKIKENKRNNVESEYKENKIELKNKISNNLQIPSENIEIEFKR